MPEAYCKTAWMAQWRSSMFMQEILGTESAVKGCCFLRPVLPVPWLDFCAYTAPWNSQLPFWSTAAPHISLNSLDSYSFHKQICSLLLHQAPSSPPFSPVYSDCAANETLVSWPLASWQPHAAPVMLNEMRHSSNPAIKPLKSTSAS